MLSLTQRTTLAQGTLSLSKTQFRLVCCVFAANLVFIPSLFSHVMHGTWGGHLVMTRLPDSLVSVLGFSVYSYTLITWHAAAAFTLAAALFIQFVLAHRKVRSARAIAAHRILGPIILCTLLPVFLLFAFSLSLCVIHTPFNHLLFTVLPVMIFYAIIRALVGLRRGDRDLHADSMFLAFMLLESAPVYRIVMFVSLLLGGPLLAPNGEPVDEGALLRTLIVLALLTFGYWSSGRLRRNLVPLALLGAVLVFSITLLPWSLTGAPK
jgi:hypothetical protein